MDAAVKPILRLQRERIEILESAMARMIRDLAMYRGTNESETKNYYFGGDAA